RHRSTRRVARGRRTALARVLDRSERRGARATLRHVAATPGGASRVMSTATPARPRASALRLLPLATLSALAVAGAIAGSRLEARPAFIVAGPAALGAGALAPVALVRLARLHRLAPPGVC